MKHVLKRYYKPLLVLALLGLLCAALCGCKPDDPNHVHDFSDGKAVHYILDSTEEMLEEDDSFFLETPCGATGQVYQYCACWCGAGKLVNTHTKRVQQHNMTEWAVETAPTCTRAGTEERHCTRSSCNPKVDGRFVILTKETRTIAALGHDYRKIDAVPATCTEAGSSGGKKCKRCGHVHGVETIPALGHDWAEPIYTWKNDYATCDAIRVCNRDASHVESAKATVLARGTGDICTEGRSIVYTATFPAGTAFTTQTYTRITQPAGHTPVVIPAVPATCTATGLTEGQNCSVCDEILVAQETVPKADHTAVEDPVEPATCVSSSGKVPESHCSVCGEVLVWRKVEPDPDNHAGPMTPVPGRTATCVSEGLKDGFYCVACRKTVQEIIPIDRNNHLMAKVVEGKKATCTAAGLTEGSVCADCGAVLTAQKEIPALGHTPAEVRKNEVAASCEEGGSYESVVYCTVCGAEISREKVETDALGHTPAEAVKENEVAATCAAKGSYESVVYCTVCGAEISREKVETDALGHTPDEAVVENEVAATCEEGGSYESVVYCTVCDAEISREKVETDALGHTPAEAVKENETPASCEEGGSYESVVYCTVCDAEISRETVETDALGHIGGTATCLARAVCERCKEAYGELGAHSYVSTGEYWEGEDKVDGKRYATWGHYEECSVCKDVIEVEDGREEIQEELDPTG